MQGPRDLPLDRDYGFGFIVFAQRMRGALCQAEIEQLNPLFRDEDVRGFQIPMDQSRAVCGIQRVQNQPRIGDGFIGRQRAFER